MSMQRTRESNKSFHLSPDAIKSLGSSAARKSLDQISPDQDSTVINSPALTMATRSTRKPKSPQDESFEDSTTYSTRSNGKKRVIDTVETPEPPPAKRGRGRPKKNTPSKISHAIEDEEANFDVRQALGQVGSPDKGVEPDTVRIEGDTVYGPGSLIRHISHINFTEKKKPAAMGAILTILEANKKAEFEVKYDANGEVVKGRITKEPLRNIPNVPDVISTELTDIWYQILLQDLCGATYTDLLHRLNAKLPPSKFSNRIMNYRLRSAKFSISPNDRELSKGALQVASRLTTEQLRYNTCWNVNKAGTKMRQQERFDDEGWMDLPHSAGDFDTANSYVKGVVAELNSCRAEAARRGIDWIKVFEERQSIKRVRRRASKGNGGYEDEDTIKVGDRSSLSSVPESSTRAPSFAPEAGSAYTDEQISAGIVTADEAPAAATTLDSMVRAMIGEHLGASKHDSVSPRGGGGARQSARIEKDMKGLLGENVALRKRVVDLEGELAAVRRSTKDQERWAKEAFRDLKSDVEALKRNVFHK